MTQHTPKWIWYPGDFELYHNMLLHARREEHGYSYGCMWHLPRPEYICQFYKTCTIPHDTTLFAAIKGEGYLSIDNYKYAVPKNGETTVPLTAGEHHILFRITNIEQFPAVYAEGVGVATDESWECDCLLPKRLHAACDPVFTKTENPAVFPFLYQPLTPVRVEPCADGGMLYDFGVESFGPVTLCAESGMGAITLVYGESREEAEDFNDAIVREVLPAFDGSTTRPCRAFRYLYVKAENGTPTLSAQLEYLPIEDKASFTCDDTKIDSIWNICSRTFHLNSREFYLDGIKRDRWCWSGDAYQSFIVNRYLYFDPSIIRRTIRALLGKRPYEQHINTINDYSAYLIIAVWEYYESTGDAAFVSSIADDLYALFQFICSRLDEETGYVVARPGDWIFIDWADIDKSGPLCAEQILLWQTYHVMAKLAEIAEIPSGHYIESADQLKASILRDFWDEERGGFIDTYTSQKKHITRHANIFAILYDFVDAATQCRIYNSILKGNLADPITTPYFKFFELMALGKMGDTVGIQDFIDSYWGGMVKLGATSVWEQFDPRKEGRAHLEMYGEEYGCSLCHAWGSGPIALLGRYCVGVKPTSIAYKTFDVAPNPGRYQHFNAVVPVCGGTVSVSYENNTVTASATVPGGTLYWNNQSAEIPVGSAVTLSGK